MQLSDILENFLSMTQDAVGISYLAPNDDCPRVVHVNPSYCDLFGQTATDVIGKPVYSIHDPETWDQISVQVGQLLRQHTNKIQVDSRCLRADGTKFWASISLFTIPDTKTGGLYTCATFRDISDLKDREKTAVNAVKDRDLLLSKQEVINTQLMVSQTRLVSAINAYPDPFAIYDKDMRLVISNAAYKKSMAVDPRSVRIGMTMHDVLNVAFDDGKIIVPPQDRQAYYDRIKHLKRTEHSVEDIEFSDGTHHRILRSVAENGDLVIIRLDVSELVHQRRQSTALYDRTIAALNAYPDPFAIYDADTRLVMWNDAFTTLVTDTPDDLAVGMTNAQVEALAARSGRIIASHATGTQEEPQGSDTALCPSAPTDLELPGDVHRRVLRSQAPNGDFVVIQMDTTELVQQRRAAEALQERLLAAISAYPAPFCIYDKAHRLAVWNDSYTAALTDDPSELRVGMSVEDVLRTGLKNQRFPQAKGREETWLQTTLEATLSLQPVEDI
ncbi:PAS-domain containing protein, partial [Roseobacter sp.]